MADTTITFSNLFSPTHREIHAGVYAIFDTYTYAATLSASQVYLALPIPDKVTVLDGWVYSTHNTSYSFLAMVGWVDAKSLFMADVTVGSSSIQRFSNGLPHVVTITATDTWPRAKPLAVTIKTAASGTLNGALTVMAFLQK